MGSRYKGFTLIETLVVIGLLIAMAGFGLFWALPSVQSVKLETIAEEICSRSFRYQQSASTGLDGKTYGVKFAQNSYSFFVGESFAVAEDIDTYALPPSSQISSIDLSGGGTEITFAPNGFRPSVAGTITLEDERDTYLLEFNSEGLITYHEI